MARVDPVQVTGEAADDAQTLGAPDGVGVGREHRPSDSEIDRDVLGSCPFEVGDEVGQHRAGTLELVAERPA